MQLSVKAEQRLRRGIEQLLQDGSRTIFPLNPNKPDSFQITVDARLLSAIYHKIFVNGQPYYLGTKK